MQTSAAPSPEPAQSRTTPELERADWLTTVDFADAVGITRQAARLLLKRSLEGKSWRGDQLQVRRVLTRGGRGGVGYEVRFVNPAPARPSAQDSEVQSTLTTPRTTDGTSARILHRLELVSSALEQPKTSSGRSEAVAEAAECGGVSRRTVYRWLSRYEAGGVRGLGRRSAANAHEKRVQISRPFDRYLMSAGGDIATLDAIRRELDAGIRGLWASRAEQAGGTEIRRLAEFMLREICERRNLGIPADGIKLSRRRVEQFAHYRVVNQRRNDRKAFDDAKPRIRRDWTALAPMERVVADVKHLDIIVTRPDGSPAWPKIVAFMDAGTGRAFVHPVLLERGEGVRQEHVIEAFLAMVADPHWGFPQGLYLDNGSEFGALVKIDAALQQLNDAGARTIIYARPYNASAKPIESLFARLDRYVFSMLPGYAGPNRMAQKTQTVGKPPKPYPGDWEEFRDTVVALVQAHNHRPVGGLWAGRSPEEWMDQKVARGWRPATVGAEALDAAFSDSDSRRVDRGILKINGKRYSHPEIAALPSRAIVDLALPWRRGGPPLARVSGGWAYLKEDAPYPARWVEGARESARRQTAQTQHVRRLEKEVPTLDPVALKLRAATRNPMRAHLARGPQLDLGAQAETRAQAAARADTQQSSASTDRELRLAREMLKTERLEQRQRVDD